MKRLYAAIALVWIVLLPPLFTDGACSREFDQANALIESNRKRVLSLDTAQTLLAEHSVPFSVVTAERCREVKPRFLSRCGSGALIYAEVPVKNPVCRFYRDDATRIQLQYDDRNRLQRFVADMAPFKSLSLPWGGYLHWGR